MKILPKIGIVLTAFSLLLSWFPVTVLASTNPPALAVPSGLSFAEIKITGDEFITIQNNSGTVIPDLSAYWLDDFNNTNPLSTGVSSSTQQLPAASLDAGQSLLLSANPMATCGASVAGKLSLSLTDAGGFLQIIQMGQSANGAVTQTPGDLVSWNSGASGVIQSVPSSTKDAKATYYRYFSGNSFAWQQADVDTSNACQLNVVVAGGLVPQTAVVTPLAMAASSPPATILGVTGADQPDTSTSSLPASDIGLLAPQLDELLPNPVGTGNDATDEFIELYNPNATNFDLSGFTLQTGTTATHSYTFPTGTLLAPASFHAFYSLVTGVSLSNSGGQARLLDPFGTIIGSSAVYGTAKDGEAWALANSHWSWTTSSTPNAANIIKVPVTAKKSAAKTTSKKSDSKAAGTSKVKGASATNNDTVSASDASDTVPTTPIHPWVLALVAVAAILYGAYEYRTDLANYLVKFRGNWKARRDSRQ